MSSVHYDAFISYRHVPRDIQVASDVQKQLEHFHVPAAIRRQTGRRRISRVFRDREELPVTSDLQESIAEALANSDFLIVICSPDTKESIWVQREIDFFLKTHSSDRVLTVLSAGKEPGEIIPEVLLYEEKDGVRQPREPLSCDYRRGLKKARREELPRLASVILGCTYDDLRQRQRQYRTRRLVAAMAAVMAALTAAAGYLLWSGHQIRDNLRQSQINESRFLANAARDEFRSGNRILAARLALEGLPSERDPDRPVSAEAEAALSEALYAYQIPSNMNVGAFRVFDTNARIEWLRTDPENRRLAALDETGTAHVWDIGTGKETVTIPPGGNDWSELAVAADGRILLFSSEGVSCRDGVSGKKLWSAEAHFPTFTLADNPTLRPYALSEDGSRLYVQKDSGWFSDEKILLEIDTADGTAVSEQDLKKTEPVPEEEKTSQKEKPSDEKKDSEAEKAPEEETVTTEYWSLRAIAADSSGRTAVLESESSEAYRVLLSGEEEDVRHVIRLPYSEVYAMGFDLDGQLLVCGHPEGADGDSAVPDSYFLYSTMTITGRYSADLSCYGRDGRRQWNREIPVTMDNCFPAVFSGNFRDDESAEMLRCDVCLAGNAVAFLDPETGEDMGSYLLPAVIMGGEVCEPSVRVVLRSGDMGYLYPNGKKAYLNRYFSENVEKAVFSGGYLANDDDALVGVLSSGQREILIYTGGIGDENWSLLESDQEKEYSSIWHYEIAGDRCAVLKSRGEEKTAALEVLDLAERKVASVTDLPGEGPDYTWMGFSPDTGIVTLLYKESLWVNETPARCLQVSTADGTIEDKEIPLPADADLNMQIKSEEGDGETFFLLTSTGTQDTGWRYDTESGELEELFSEDKQDFSSTSVSWMLPSPDGLHFILIYDTGEVTLLDAETKEVRYLERDIFHGNVPYSREDLHCAWSDDGTFLLTCSRAEEICLADCSGAVCLSIPCPGKSPESVCLHDGEAWILFGDASLERYSAADGAFLGKIDLEKDGTVFSMYAYRWQWRDGGELQIGGGGRLYIVDTAASICTQKIELCMGYSEPENLFLLNLNSYETDVPYGFYERYSLEDLIRMGHEMTDGQPVSQDDQEKYGLKED